MIFQWIYFFLMKYGQLFILKVKRWPENLSRKSQQKYVEREVLSRVYHIDCFIKTFKMNETCNIQI